MKIKKCFISIMVISLSLGTYGFAAAKCGTNIYFGFNPGIEVAAGTFVTMTEEIKTSGTGSCTSGNYVSSGTAAIQALQWNGESRPCAEEGKKYCSQGNVGETCASDNQCDIDGICDNGVCAEGNVGAGCSNNPDCKIDGECTAVEFRNVASENPTDGTLTYMLNTTGLGGQTLGFQAIYTGDSTYNNATPSICTDLTINEVEACSGATISIDFVSGPGAPAPGGPYYWDLEILVHACEDLIGVTAQGGTNGWAPLVDRSALLITDTGDAVIRKANKKNETILWTIGDMVAGQDATLTIPLSGSIPDRTPDCQVRYLSGPWSALFSTDAINFEKTDYTGRVSIQIDSDGDGNDDCEL